MKPKPLKSFIVDAPTHAIVARAARKLKSPIGKLAQTYLRAGATETLRRKPTGKKA